MKKSSVSRMQRFMYSQILCYVLERWFRTQQQILLENSSWICFKGSSQYRTLDTIDGEPMEFERNISQDSLHWSLSKKSRSSWTTWANHNNSKDELFSCRCSMTPYGDVKTMKRNLLPIPHLCLFTKRFPAGHWLRNKVVFHWQRKTRRKMGSSRWIDDDQIRRKRTPSFPCHESIVPRNAQKQRWWKIINTLLCRWGYDWNCFSHTYLSISSVSTEQSQICVRNTVPVKQVRGDLCWQNNLTHCLSKQVCWWKHLHLWPKIQKYQERVERTSQQNRVL